MSPRLYNEYGRLLEAIEGRLHARWVHIDDYDAAIRLIRSIADMPASTHEIDRALCKEWLSDNGSGE